MRVPKIENYDNSKIIETLKLNKPYPVNKTYIVMNDKDKIKFIKAVEAIVRKSIEYKQYIQFLKNEIDMTQCSFFKNINNKNNRPVSIEIHHEPFTLFDITNVIVDKWISLEKELNPLLIAEEIMGLHYKNFVGLTPLSVTVHELVHDGKLFIPLQSVYGDYLSFIEEYGAYISELLEQQLHTKLTMSREIENPDTTILEKKYVYLEVDGFSFPQLLSE